MVRILIFELAWFGTTSAVVAGEDFWHKSSKKQRNTCVFPDFCDELGQKDRRQGFYDGLPGENVV